MATKIGDKVNIAGFKCSCRTPHVDGSFRRFTEWGDAEVFTCYGSRNYRLDILTTECDMADVEHPGFPCAHPVHNVK